MEYLRLLFGALGADEAEAEARSTLAFSLMIGHHFMAADHGATDRSGLQTRRKRIDSSGGREGADHPVLGVSPDVAGIPGFRA